MDRPLRRLPAAERRPASSAGNGARAKEEDRKNDQTDAPAIKKLKSAKFVGKGRTKTNIMHDKFLVDIYDPSPDASGWDLDSVEERKVLSSLTFLILAVWAMVR